METLGRWSCGLVGKREDQFRKKNNSTPLSPKTATPSSRFALLCPPMKLWNFVSLVMASGNLDDEWAYHSVLDDGAVLVKGGVDMSPEIDLHVPRPLQQMKCHPSWEVLPNGKRLMDFQNTFLQVGYMKTYCGDPCSKLLRKGLSLKNPSNSHHFKPENTLVVPVSSCLELQQNNNLPSMGWITNFANRNHSANSINTATLPPYLIPSDQEWKSPFLLLQHIAKRSLDVHRSIAMGKSFAFPQLSLHGIAWAASVWPVEVQGFCNRFPEKLWLFLRIVAGVSCADSR
ncbi:hypothetical protein Tco_0323528 [Tanacetum coccineum]